MTKRFLVEPGYLARIGARWHDYRATMVVVEDETVDLSRRAATVGRAPMLITSYAYADLDPEAPPVGFYRVEASAGRAAPFLLVAT